MSINPYTSFAVIGGDRRQIYMAKSISQDGYHVTVCGLGKSELISNIENANILDAALSNEIIILPVPTIKDGGIYAPLCDKKIIPESDFFKAIQGKKVFCGMKDGFIKLFPDINSSLFYDYLQREDFAISNAVPTAEGALELAIKHYEGTIHKSRCLVCGFGRIGKILSNYLKFLGADVTVSARKSSDIAMANALSFNAVYTEQLSNCEAFDIIFNTVPVMIFNSCLLAKIAPKALMIELASAPGGIDFSACERLKITAVKGLSLPGKTAPKTAGEIIKQTIYKMLEEG